MEYTTLFLVIFSGTLMNFGTFITIATNGKTFGVHVRFLIKHQSLIDGFACLVTSLILLQTDMRWTTGKYFILLDIFPNDENWQLADCYRTIRVIS